MVGFEDLFENRKSQYTLIARKESYVYYLGR